jgi:hypothetical protein
MHKRRRQDCFFWDITAFWVDLDCRGYSFVFVCAGVSGFLGNEGLIGIGLEMRWVVR